MKGAAMISRISIDDQALIDRKRIISSRNWIWAGAAAALAGLALTWSWLAGIVKLTGAGTRKACDGLLSGYAVSGAAAISAQAENALARAAR